MDGVLNQHGGAMRGPPPRLVAPARRPGDIITQRAVLWHGYPIPCKRERAHIPLSALPGDKRSMEVCDDDAVIVSAFQKKKRRRK